MHAQLSKNITFLNIKIAKYFNSKRVKKLTFKEKNRVFLLYKNIKTKKLSRKLNYIKIKLFKIFKVVSLVNYRLKLPKIIRIYPVFHVLLLKLAP